MKSPGTPDVKPNAAEALETWIDELTAPCGLDCFNCGLFVHNITESVQQSMANRLGRRPEEIPCRGCRTEDGCRLSSGACETRACARDRGFFFCFECRDFPCPRFSPARDGGGHPPHNLKLFNLCRIRSIGVERWAAEESLMIRRRYHEGTCVPGCGPVLDEDTV